MYKSVLLHRRSQYDQFLLMKAVEEYCDTWPCDIDYCESIEQLDELFLMLDFESFRKLWQGYFLQALERGCLTLSADSGTGCAYELTNKIVPEDGSFTVTQYSNVMDPIVIGVAPDLGSALHLAIVNLGSYIKGFKYERLGMWK